MIATILLMFAFVLFVVAAWRSAQPDAARLVALGLALWVASQLAGRTLG